MWEKFNEDRYIEESISKHRFYLDELDNMNPYKLFNYLLQCNETSLNTLILWDVLKLLNGKKTKLVLYTYDAILLDVCKEEKEILNKINSIFLKYELKVNLKNGRSYDFE